jgi:hypothetical protein
MEKDTGYVGKKQRSCKWNQTGHTENWKEVARMVLEDHPISQPRVYISPIWTLQSHQESVNYNSGQCRLQWELYLYCMFHTEKIRVFLWWILFRQYFVNNLILETAYVYSGLATRVWRFTVSTLIGGLCFLCKPYWRCCWCAEAQASSIY